MTGLDSEDRNMCVAGQAWKVIAYPAFNSILDVVPHEPAWISLMNYDRCPITTTNTANRNPTTATEVLTTVWTEWDPVRL